MNQPTLRAAIDDVPPYETENPQPLRRPIPEGDPFPVDYLGKTLAPVAQALHDRVQAPLGICAQSVLALATLAVQGHADVALPGHQRRPLSCFFLTIAGSGERKSACDSIALKATQEREAELRESYTRDILKWRNEKEAWDTQRKAVLNSKKNITVSDKTDALNALGPEPAPPLSPILTCEEPTFEGLCLQLMGGWPSVGIFSAEGGQFIGGHGMGSDHKLKTAAALSKVWDGDPIKRVRAGDGTTILPGRRVCMHLMAQQDVARGFLSDPVLADQGMLSRFLVCAPESTAGTRFSKKEHPSTATIISGFSHHILNLLRQPMPMTPGKTNELAPRLLEICPKAMAIALAFADDVESKIGPNGPFAAIKPFANKMCEHALRMAGVMTLIDDLQARTVSIQALENGIMLAQYYAAEALRLFEVGTVDKDILMAERLRDWLRDHWDQPHISLPDIYQYGPSSVRTKAKAKRLVDILVEHNHLSPTDGPITISGQTRRQAWRLLKEKSHA